MKEYFITK